MGLEEPETAHSRLRVITIDAIRPGLATVVFEVGMFYALDNPSRPVHLIIRSDGGDLFESVCVVNALRDIKSALNPGIPLIGTVQGNAFSGASYVLQACDRRYAAPTAVIMVHGITTRMATFDEADAERNLDLVRNMRATLADAYAARSTKPRSYWDENLQTNKELYFTAQEALEAGLIDEVR